MRKHPRIDSESQVPQVLRDDRQKVNQRIMHDKKARRKFVKNLRKMKKMQSRMRGEDELG